MKKIVKVIVPLLLALLVLSSICWYLFIYDRDFTQSFLLNRARIADKRGNYTTAARLYDLAYRYSNEDEDVAIELAEQFKSIGNYTKAEYTLSNAISDGGSAQLYIALCKTYVEQDKLLDAVTMLDNIADPDIKAQIDKLRPKAPESDHDQPYYNEYISINLASEDGDVYYTVNGEYPSLQNAPLTEPLPLEGGKNTIFALTISENSLVSSLQVLDYTIAGVIEEVSISNEALDTIIREQLNVSDNHVLFSNQLWNITSLEITEDVQDLSELSKLPLIETLTIHQGNYENLSEISKLTQLQTLTIDGVTLTTDELKIIAELPDLTALSLVRCNLSSIAELSSAAALIRLDVNSNTIRDLNPLSNLSKLEYLNISHNAVNQLSALTGVTALKNLDASYNSVNSTIALSGCKNLETLRLDYNALTSFEGLDKLAELKYLYANHNQISDITHLNSMTELYELDISNNAVTDLSPLSGAQKLSVLNFENNQIATLPKFSENSALSTINGSRNLLTNLDTLSGLSQLNYVIMDYNAGISSIAPLSKCAALVEVSVLGTAVTDVSALDKMKVIVRYAPI